MKLKLLLLFTLTLLFSCETKKGTKKSKIETQVVQEIKKELVEGIYVYNYEGLKPLLNKTGDKTYIVNFWATWCKPCVDELPFFEKINREYKDKNVEVLLVSLDFGVQKDLLPFIKDNNITSEVVLLDDPKENIWVEAIDPSWSGALPATIIYNTKKRVFYEQSFEEDELVYELNKFIK